MKSFGKESVRIHGWFGFFSPFFLPPSLWLMEVRHTLYIFRTSSVTYSLFPENSHSGETKKGEMKKDSQWQIFLAGMQEQDRHGAILAW